MTIAQPDRQTIIQRARAHCRADGAPLGLWQLHEVLWRTCRRAELREVRWHDLRTFASRLASEGVPLRQVQAWEGHSTLTMVLRYSHLAPGENADLIRVLERAPGQQVGSGVVTPLEKGGTTTT
jgi:integrase